MQEINVVNSSLAKENCVRRGILLKSMRVATLRKRIAGWGGPALTVVKAVSALIWKCSAAASRKNRTNNNKTPGPRPSMLALIVDLRRWFQPRLPSNLARNLAGFFAARADRREMQVPVLAGRLRGATEGYCECHVRRLQGDDACMAICEESKGFWPARRVRMAPNFFVLLDAKVVGGGGGGIEVWLTLWEEDMALLEQDPSLLEFASPNPNICW